MAFEELHDFLDPDLHIPFRGKQYTVPAASFEDGLYLQEMFSLAGKASSGADPSEKDKALLNDDDELTFYRRALTEDLFETLKSDGVPFSVIKRMAGTAMMEAVLGREQAEAFWASSGKAPEPTVKKPADRKPKTVTPTRVAGAGTTRKPASQTTTKTTKPRTAGSGRNSSSTGA